MNKSIFLGILVLLSTSLDAFAGQISSGSSSKAKKSDDKKDIEVSGPTGVKKLTPDYVRPSEEVESKAAYEKLLALKQNPKTAYDVQMEVDLTEQEEAIENTLEEQHSEEERIANNIKTIESKMPTIYSKALQAVTFGFFGGGSPSTETYSQEDLTKVREALTTLKTSIAHQEAELEQVSKEINDLSSEKDKLETSFPTLVKQSGDKPTTSSKAYLLEKEKIKKADPLRERLKATKLGNTSDTTAMAILAERFLIKLGALDTLYDTLSEKIKTFRARIAEDQEILKMMSDDPELSQEAAGWGSRIYARIFVVGNTETGLTNEQNNKLRNGLARIKKVLNDEVAQYKDIVKSFEEYTLSLPKKINDFKVSKSKFFKVHHDTISKMISVANRNVVDRLVDSLNKKATLEKSPAQPQKENSLQQIAAQIDKLRNLSASYKRQRNFLDQAVDVRPFSEEEFKQARKRSQEATAEKTDQSSMAKKEGTVDDMLEALVNLTQVVKGSAPDIINPLVNENVKGFFGAALIKQVAKAGAPAAISALTGLLQTKLAQAVSEGSETYNQSSPQIRLLKVVTQIKEINQKLALKSQKENEKQELSQAKDRLMGEIQMLKWILDCSSSNLEPAKRLAMCTTAAMEIDKKTKNPHLSEEDKELLSFKEQLLKEKRNLENLIKTKLVVASKATNPIQRQQESQGLILEALIGILQNSSQVRVETYINTIEPLLPEFQAAFLEKGKKKVVEWIIPYISGLLDSKLSEKLGELSQDPTKLKYNDSRIVDLLTARITHKPGTPEYEELSQQIKTAYEGIKAVREAYRQKLMTLSDQHRVHRYYGLGSETETSIRQNKRAEKQTIEAAKQLNQDSKAYKADIQQQYGK